MSSLFAFDTIATEDLESTEDNYRLLCHFSYERIETSSLQRDTFVTFGRKTPEGIVKFEYQVDSISAYSFLIYDSNAIPEVNWHHNSKILVNLDMHPNGEIKYRFRFFNYGDNNRLNVVFDEKREVFKPGIVYLNEAAFNYYEGTLIEGRINQETWINERGVTLDRCRIDVF